MNKQCQIVQDLLPLYVDSACSEASAEMVREHLAGCPDCRQLHERLCADTGEEMLKEEIGGVVARHDRKAKRRGVAAVVVSVTLTVVLLFVCVRFRPVSIDYGTSALYSRQDMNEAIALIKETFYSWEGCRLYSISYTDDAFCRREVDYVNTLAPEGVTYAECIVFRMRFRSPIFGGGAWNANFTYDWSWYLARAENGEWELLTWGMP